MKNLKKLVATATLMGIIIIGVTDVKAGIIFTNLSDQSQQCTEVNTDKVDYGIIFTSLTSFLKSLIKDDTMDCGIIFTN